MRDRGKTRAAKAAAAAATAKPSAAEEPEPPRDEPSPPPPEPKEEVPIVVVTKSEEHTVSAAPPVVVVSPEFSAASLLLQQTLVRLQAKVAENKANEITSSDIQTMQRQFDEMLQTHPTLGKADDLAAAAGINPALVALASLPPAPSPQPSLQIKQQQQEPPHPYGGPSSFPAAAAGHHPSQRTQSGYLPSQSNDQPGRYQPQLASQRSGGAFGPPMIASRPVPSNSAGWTTNEHHPWPGSQQQQQQLQQFGSGGGGYHPYQQTQHSQAHNPPSYSGGGYAPFTSHIPQAGPQPVAGFRPQPGMSQQHGAPSLAATTGMGMAAPYRQSSGGPQSGHDVGSDPTQQQQQPGTSDLLGLLAALQQAEPSLQNAMTSLLEDTTTSQQQQQQPQSAAEAEALLNQAHGLLAQILQQQESQGNQGQ